MADGQVVFEITADGKQAIASVKDITNAINRETQNWDQATRQSTDNIESSFSGMVKKIAAGISAAKIGKAILDWGKSAVDAASDLAEVQNVVDVTFGDGAKQIESWSKTAGKQFGLTETQAKKFTSTLGAMMKSSGMSGDEIVGMSTDLAGLAADMASFYNLDFETAFQKIRSGISGETEPLKQLGVNMSVANLEAFALEQGITKSFNAMTQGEQTMLRYQYLMQATADAQGDFSRTSDGFANASRRIETALNTINTAGGNLLMAVIEPLTAGLADILEKVTAQPDETLFDKVSAIDIDAQGKLAEIQQVAEEANGLIGTLGVISGTDAGEAIGKMAEGANKLNASSSDHWKGILTALQGVDGLENIFSNTSAAGNVQALADALAGSSLDTDKVTAWRDFLGALSENADAVSKLTGSSVEETKAWLESLSEAVNSIDAGDAEAWNSLLTTLVSGFSADTPEGQKFIEGLASEFLAMGSDSEVAAKGLQALGFGTDQIADKQSEWLKVCKQLVQTIPGLSEIINTETGEVKGGIGALSEYVDEWKQSQEKLVYWKAFYAKKQALAETEGNLYSMRVTAGGAQYALDQFLQNNPTIANLYNSGGGAQAVMREGGKAGQEFLQLWENAKNATEKYNTALAQSSELTEQLANEEQWLIENYGEAEEAATEAGEAASDFGGKSADAWKETTGAVNDAVKALADYVKGVHDATAQAVNGVVKGFDTITRPTTELEKKRDKLIQQQNALNTTTKDGQKKFEELQKQIDELNESMDQYSPKGMQDGLKSQIAFMEEYISNLEKAREMGLSNELLASLSDGSAQSAEYLSQLVANPEQAGEVDKLFQQAQEMKKGFTDALTQQKLTVDETYQAMVDAAKTAVEQMNQGDAAAAAMGETVSGLAQGISDHVSEVATAVDSIIAELDRLNGLGVSINLGSFGSINFTLPFSLDGSHALGLDYVPFNGYLAELHEGEGILTAEENRIWQRFKNGGAASQNVDYDALGGVMRDNVKAGGDVYLDGRVVGSVISAQQGKSYRALQRSGWQS
jgi:hypothetical protein